MGSMLQIYVHIADAESEGGYLEVPLDVRTMESIDTIKSKLLEETDILDPGDFELTLDGLMLDSDLMVAETRIVDGTLQEPRNPLPTPQPKHLSKFLMWDAGMKQRMPKDRQPTFAQ